MTQDSPAGGEPEEPTVSLASDDTPTTTGPTVASWPLDDLMQPPPEVGPLVWRDPHSAYDNRNVRETRSPAYYVSLTVAVLLVLGLVAATAVLTVNRPVTRVAGAPAALNIPQLPPPTSSGPTTTAPPSTAPPGDDFGEFAAHPLSTSSATMADQTCSLPRFDPANDAQATFYAAAKVCADNAFTGLLESAGLATTPVEVVTVQGGPVETPCGAVEPSSPATQCDGTVYMTPAHLRDTEGNGRYPGRYFGVFLREYARAVQAAAGFGDLYKKAESAGVSTEDLDLRRTQQAICLAGIASGAMSGRGAVDGNITTEIRERLTDVDAPADAGTWLDKGFQSRQPSACNSWS